MPVHPLAATGFSRAVAEYDRGRPEAPTAAIDLVRERLRLSAGSRVVELGAGTGKFAHRLAPQVAEYVAIEPLRARRGPLVRAPGRRLLALAGTAERIPLTDQVADAVVAVPAFHWFRTREAVPEIHRILRPGGGVGLLWNVRDESVPGMRRVSELLAEYDPGGPRLVRSRWREEFEAFPGFEPLQAAEIRFRHRIDRDGAIARFTSISFIAALAPDRRTEFAERLRRLLDSDPGLSGREIDVPYRCQVFWTAREGGRSNEDGPV
jgi:SAM-dependent methyltransferase